MADTPPPEATTCPACGAPAAPRAQRCRSCGEPLTEEARTARSSNGLVLFLLLVMGLAFATVYYMRARARGSHRPPPALGTDPAPPAHDAHTVSHPGP
jgi:predicted nucleic acid-binding Zn ribbon protein